jgi:hypothetical protein
MVFDMRYWIIAGILLIAGVGAASAQTTQAIVVSACGTPPLTYHSGQPYPITQDTTGTLCSSTGGGGGSSDVNIVAVGGNAVTTSVPVSAAPISAIAGTQENISIATATALTVPMGATLAIIQAQGTNNSSGVCLYWRDDGTNPTNAAGQALSAFATLSYKVSSLPIKLIAASGATCTATISYYQ